MKMANGKWHMANGIWQMAYRRWWKSALRPLCSDFLYLLSAIRHTLTALRSSVRGLRSPLFSLLIAVLLAGVSLAVEGDIVFKRPGSEAGVPAAVFPHWFHRIRFKCYACHPSIFEMEAGANKITMDAIKEGKFCGTCHNGKIAWEVGFQTCSRCHSGN